MVNILNVDSIGNGSKSWIAKCKDTKAGSFEHRGLTFEEAIAKGINHPAKVDIYMGAKVPDRGATIIPHTSAIMKTASKVGISAHKLVSESADRNINDTRNVNNGIVYNVATKKLTLNNEHIKLSGLEEKFIDYLFINSGVVITVEDIIENVWGGKRASIYTIRNYVANIRRRLNDYNKCIVKNVSGKGYVLIESIG